LSRRWIGHSAVTVSIINDNKKQRQQRRSSLSHPLLYRRYLSLQLQGKYEALGIDLSWTTLDSSYTPFPTVIYVLLLSRDIGEEFLLFYYYYSFQYHFAKTAILGQVFAPDKIRQVFMYHDLAIMLWLDPAGPLSKKENHDSLPSIS